MRALLIDVELNFRKIDVMQPDRPCISSHLAGQVDDLLQRSLACVRGRVKIYRVQLHASLGDHVAGNGGIDTSGEEQHGLAAHADRKSARSGDDRGIDVYFLTDLDVQHDLRIMYIHCEVGAGREDRFAQLLVDLHGVKRIFLVQPPGVYLESGSFSRILFLHKSSRRVPELLDGDHWSLHDRADAGNTEDAAERFGDFAVIILRQALHKDSAIGPVHGKISLAGLERVLDLAHQRLFKYVAVLAFDADLRVLDQKRLIFHNSSVLR